MKVQEQVVDSFGEPLVYKARIGVDPILLDQVHLFTALETGGLELTNSQVHQHLVLHHLGLSMHESTIFLWEIYCVVGSLYRPANLSEVSLRDLQWLEMARGGSPA